MAKKQDPNSLGAMMAAQNELTGINSSRLQNSQAEQAFLQQQQAANAVMMQATQIGTSDSLGQQVGGMNPQTQAILAQYGITGSAPMPGKTTNTSKTTSSGGNVKIENNTTTNNEVKIVNAGGGSSGDSGNQTKFQVWLSNVFAKQNQEYEVQRRIFARRDRDLEKQSNKMMRSLEKTTAGLSEKLNPDNWQKSQGNQLKFIMKLLLLTAAPALIKPISERLEKLREIFTGKGKNENTEGEEKGFFQKLSDAIGIGTEGESPWESIRKTLEDGFNGIKDWLKLLTDERSRAIGTIKPPGKGGGAKLDPSSWIKYLSNVVRAGLGGLDALAENSAKSLRSEVHSSFTRNDIPAVDLQQNAAGIVKAYDPMEFRSISSDYYSLTGHLKGGNSGASIAVTRGIFGEYQNATEFGLHFNVSIVGKRMSDLENLLEREGSFKLGLRYDALNFLKVWNLDEKYLEKMIDEGLIFSEKFMYVTWVTYEEGKQRKLNSGLFIKGETYPFDPNIEPIQYETEVEIYFIKKEGFEKIKKDLFGSEKFDFSDPKNDLHLKRFFSNKHPGLKFHNEKNLQNIQDYINISNEYQEDREEVSLGRAGDVIDVVSEGVKTTGQRLSEITTAAWNRLTGNTLMQGEYPKTDEGNNAFIRDLYGVFSKKLKEFYLEQGLSEEEATSRAAEMAKILVGQCAHESGYGTNHNSPYYNYANLTATEEIPGKTRLGPDHDKNGGKITQIFRTFNSAEEFADEMIALLNRGQYGENKALFANNSKDYFERIQKGYKDNPENGKFAQDPNYISNGIDSVNSIVPKINEYISELNKLEENNKNLNTDAGEVKGDLITEGETQAFITKDKKYKVVFGEDLGKDGITPWEARTGVYQFNEKTSQYDIPVDSNLMGTNLMGPNSLEETVNRSVSKSSYPELGTSNDKINSKEKILFYTQKRKKFTKLAQEKILESYQERKNWEKPDNYENIPFYLIPTKDGNQFTILTISVRTRHLTWEKGPMWTGNVYESPNGDSDFPKDCKKNLAPVVLNNCPHNRNPLFYDIAFNLDKDGIKALRKWKQILKTLHVDEKGSLKYLDEDGNAKIFYRNNKFDKNAVKELRRAGLINDYRTDRLFFKTTLTEKGKDFYGYSNNPLSPEEQGFKSMSEEEKRNYFNYLIRQEKDPAKQAALRLLDATAENALIEAQRIVGVVGSNINYKVPTTQRITPPLESQRENTSALNPYFNSNIGNDNSVHNSSTNIHMYFQGSKPQDETSQ